MFLKLPNIKRARKRGVMFLVVDGGDGGEKEVGGWIKDKQVGWMMNWAGPAIGRGSIPRF